MTPGENLLASIKLKSVFYDRHERRAYLRAVEIAKHIVDDPSLIRMGEAFLERHMRFDPHQARYYSLWKRALTLPPEDISRALLEDSDLGAELRGSAPVFVVLGDPAGAGRIVQ